MQKIPVFVFFVKAFAHILCVQKFIILKLFTLIAAIKTVHPLKRTCYCIKMKKR